MLSQAQTTPKRYTETEINALIQKFIALAVKTINEGNFTQGQTYIDKAVEMSEVCSCSPRIKANAYVNRASLAYKMHNMELLISDAKTALKYEPECSEAVDLLLTAYKDDKEKTRQYFKLKVKLTNANATSNTDMLPLLIQFNPNVSLDKIRAAAKLLRKAHFETNKSPVKTIIQYLETAKFHCRLDIMSDAWLGHLYFETRQFDKAIESYSIAINNFRKPNGEALVANKYFSIVFFARGRSFFAKQNYSAALIDFESGMFNDEDGTALKYKNFPDEVLCEYLKCREKVSHKKGINGDNLCFADEKDSAYSNLQKELYKEAIKNFDKLIYLNSTNSKFFADRAMAHDKNGNFDQALGDLVCAIWLCKAGLDKEHVNKLPDYYALRQSLCLRNKWFRQSFMDYLELGMYANNEEEQESVRKNIFNKYCEYANLHEQRGEYETAIKYYECAYKTIHDETISERVAEIDEFLKQEKFFKEIKIEVVINESKQEIKLPPQKKETFLEQNTLKKFQKKQEKKQRNLANREKRISATNVNPDNENNIEALPFDPKIINVIDATHSELESMGATKIYLVGGVMGDIIDKNKQLSGDIDYAIDLAPSKVTAQPNKNKERLYSLNRDQIKVDVYCSQFLEAKDFDGDKKNRDFSFCCIYGVYKNKKVTIIDGTGSGIKHYKAGEIHTVIPAHISFSEQGDPVRMLRAIYFAAKKGFTLSEEVRLAIHQHAHLLKEAKYAGAVNANLHKILSLKNPTKVKKAFRLLITQGIFKELFPGLNNALHLSEDPTKRNEVYKIIKFECTQKSSLTSLYDQFLQLISDENLMNIADNPLLVAEYTRAQKHRIQNEYAACSTSPWEIDWWLLRTLFANKKIVENFNLLVEENIFEKMFPSFYPLIKENLAWLKEEVKCLEGQDKPSLCSFYVKLMVCAVQKSPDKLAAISELRENTALFKHAFHNADDLFNKLVTEASNKYILAHPPIQTLIQASVFQNMKCSKQLAMAEQIKTSTLKLSHE